VNRAAPDLTAEQGLEDDGGQYVLRFEPNASLLPPVEPGRTFRKAVQAVHCYPAKGDLTAIARRVLNALFIHAQDTVKSMPEDQRALIKEYRGTPIFTMGVGRLRKYIQQAGRDHKRLYDALQNIYEWSFYFNVMGDGGGQGEPQLVERVQSRIISVLRFADTDETLEQGQFRYELPHDVLLMILEPRPYAQIDMRAVNGLGSNHAIGLYENLVRYLGTRNRVTAVQPIQEWINLLSGVGNYSGPGQYKNFKRFVLVPAMAWLEKLEAVPFTAELIEIKGPRNRVTHLQFRLIPKQQAALDMGQIPPSWSPRLVETLRTVYGMPVSRIAEVARMTTEEELQEALRRDSAAIAKKTAAGEVVADRAAYLLGIVRNVQRGRPRDAEPELDPTDQEPSRDQVASQVRAAMARAQALRAEFRNQQLRLIRERADALDDDALEVVRADFATAQAGSASVRTMLARGWKRGDTPLNNLLATWILEQPASVTQRFLFGPEETDFDVWAELQRSQGTGEAA
jgi:hypothetical protein